MATECTWKAAFTPSNPPTSLSLRRIDRSKQHSDDEWELHKRRIIELYSVFGLELTQVMKQMQDEEGFSASLSQYRKQLKTWNVVKYSKYTEKQLKFMLHVIHKRYKQGKYKTGFRLHGRPLNPNQIERTLLRKLHGPLGKDIEVLSNVKQDSDSLAVPVLIETPRPYKIASNSGRMALSPVFNCSPGGLSPFTPQKSPCVRGGKMLRHLEKGSKPEDADETGFKSNFESKHVDCSKVGMSVEEQLQTGISNTLRNRHTEGEVFKVQVEYPYPIKSLLRVQIVCGDCDNNSQVYDVPYTRVIYSGGDLHVNCGTESKDIASRYEADHINTQGHQRNLIMELLQDLPEEHDDLETMFSEIASCTEAGITTLDQLLDIHT